MAVRSNGYRTDPYVEGDVIGEPRGSSSPFGRYISNDEPARAPQAPPAAPSAITATVRMRSSGLLGLFETPDPGDLQHAENLIVYDQLRVEAVRISRDVQYMAARGVVDAVDATEAMVNRVERCRRDSFPEGLGVAMVSDSARLFQIMNRTLQDALFEASAERYMRPKER